MGEVLLGSYQTLNHTDKEWTGHIAKDAVTLVPRSEDRLLVRYGYAEGRVTRKEMLEDNIIHVPESFRDERLSLASVDSKGNWLSFFVQEASHQELRLVPYVYNLLYHMRKGQKMMKVGMVSGDSQGDMQGEVSTVLLVQLVEIYHQSELRMFYLPKLPSGLFSTKLNSLNIHQGLTVKRGTNDAVVTVDIQKFALMDVHRTLGEMLLSRPTHLTRSDGFTRKSQEFVSVAADVILMGDTDMEAIFKGFARENDLYAQVLEDVRQKRMFGGYYYY